MDTLTDLSIRIEDATAEAVAPYGHFIAARAGQPVFAEWPGTTVFGQTPFEIERGGELIMVRMDAKTFPHQLTLIERHALHTQAYLPANGRPFIMVLGIETGGGMPVLEKLRAFRFPGGSGVVLHKDIWHDFPYALEDDTQFAVLLANTAHEITHKHPTIPMEADGPDLERRSVRARATVMVGF